MKKIILLAIIWLGVWSYYQKDISQNPSAAIGQPTMNGETIQNNQEPNVSAKSKFQCDGRQYCRQMSSRDEAEYFIRNCQSTKMDGDHDGIPCENDSRF